MKPRGGCRAAPWGVLAALALAAPVQSAEPVEVRPSRETAATLRSQSAPQDGLERWHDGFFLGVQDFITRLDSRFVDEDESALPVPISPFRIGLESESIRRASGSVEMRPRIDLDILLQLPNLERRVQVFVTSDTLSESPLTHRASSAVRAGVRLGALQNVDLDLGVRADVPPVAFASLRWQRVLAWDHWQVLPLAKIYVESGKGIGAAAGASFERWWDHGVFRAASYANWRLDTGDTEFTQSLTFARASEVLRQGRYSDVVGGRDFARGYGLQLLASGTHDTGAQRYEASLFLKRPTAARWLYWSVAPLVSWERNQHWHPDPGIRIGLDALFWDVSRR